MEENLIDGAIGFNCHAKNLLVIHPSELYMIYSTGSLVIIKSVDGSKDKVLKGHASRVNYLTVSKQGNLLASGEISKNPQDD